MDCVVSAGLSSPTRAPPGDPPRKLPHPKASSQSTIRPSCTRKVPRTQNDVQ